MKLKKLLSVSVSFCLFSGCANQITYPQTITELSKDSEANQKAYTLIHDAIARLNELDSYTYTLSTLSYDPIEDEPIGIETSKYKIKNEEKGYSGVGLIRSMESDLKLKAPTTISVNTYSFENNDEKQKMRDEISNGYACEMDCTRSITKGNPSHRYLLSPKENLYDTLLGEKVGFLQNVASAQYEESSVLKETYKTKKNYLTSFINAKMDNWQDTIIRMDQQETIIEYTVNIDLGQEYLEMIRSSLEDEKYLEVLDAQINGNIPYVQNIIRKDTITIDANGYLKERDSKYTIVDSREEAHSIEFEDIVDISKVLNFNFTYAETAVNETIEYLIGTYSFIKPDGTLRSLSFSNASAWIEESGKTTMCSYSLKNGILKLNLMDENGNIIKTEKYQVSADYSYLTDSNGNNYTYVIQVEEVYEQDFDFSYSDSIEDDVSEELPKDLETSQED